MLTLGQARGARAGAEALDERPQVQHLQDLTDALCRQALALAGQPQGATHASEDLAALLARPDFVHRLGLALAAGVARVLGLHDPRIVAVYGYQPAPPPTAAAPPAEAPAAVAIHLLIVVTAPSAALQAFVGSLERALAASLSALPAFRQWQRAFVLDVNIMTQHAFQDGLGFARFLSAGPALPTQLWAGGA